jgi:hypothetical protein
MVMVLRVSNHEWSILREIVTLTLYFQLCRQFVALNLSPYLHNADSDGDIKSLFGKAQQHV